MMLRNLLAASAFLLAPACQEPTGPAPEYRPGEAGTVDQAMCLLGFEAVPLREVSTGHHLVTASINGESASFVLDTGSNVTVIERSVAERFGVSEQGGMLGGIGEAVAPAGAGQARQVRIDELQLGSIAIRQGRVVTADLGQLLSRLGQVAGEEVSGIIGQDVLNEHHAIIDVARPMLYLMEEDREPAPVPAEQCSGEEEPPAEAQPSG